MACLTLALLLVSDTRGRYVLLVCGPSEHQPALVVEVAGLPTDAAQTVVAETSQGQSWTGCAAN